MRNDVGFVERATRARPTRERRNACASDLSFPNAPPKPEFVITRASLREPAYPLHAAGAIRSTD